MKGGWSWLGEMMKAGDVLDAPSAQWIQNRVNDGGLVEPIEDVPELEQATAPEPETAVLRRPRRRTKTNSGE